MNNALFTRYQPGDSPVSLLLNILGDDLRGIVIDPSSVNFIGAPGSASFFNSVNFGRGASLPNSGILLTNGDGVPPLANTSPSYGLPWGTPGDTELTSVAQTAFPLASTTGDASILEFSFVRTDPRVQSIQFSVLFGSEEYPNFVNSSFVDIAAITVNGENYALIDGNPQLPLSVVGTTVSDGRFLDNTDGSLPIEYNGITRRLVIPISLEPDVNRYDVRIGIADTGDLLWDSGLFVSDFKTSSIDFGGLVLVPVIPDVFNVLRPVSPNTATLFEGNSFNNFIFLSNSSDVVDVTAGGSNVIQGTLQQFQGTRIIGFQTNDFLFFEEINFSFEQLTVTFGSAILEIDANDDGEVDAELILDGDYRNGSFVVEEVDGGTQITFVEDADTSEDTSDDLAEDKPDDAEDLDDDVSPISPDDTSPDDEEGQLIFGLGLRGETLVGGLGDDTIAAFYGDDLILVESGNNLVFGNEGDDVIQGGDGDDTLFGGQGDDSLVGGYGDNVLSGDLGNDTLTGGGGNNMFVLREDGGTDLITDFTLGRDVIGLLDDLSFESLEFSQVDEDAMIRFGEETLAILLEVDATDLASDTNFQVLSWS
ncbi:hypothetical protein E1H12_20250 [Geitlerinema sp. P-1104]|uniref:choice-of-anchor L domain-containing protein n=1 Tax=Geitlerinema sp. P-1104 TaxID=2546230 RepID=UPI0014775A64|nr:choice-of-anchor L domain-containing protein [Geitlerinema sp. P-1104]NMG60778.1 hypothetical protein [Geitlerinema sp. P-1104]